MMQRCAGSRKGLTMGGLLVAVLIVAVASLFTVGLVSRAKAKANAEVRIVEEIQECRAFLRNVAQALKPRVQLANPDLLTMWTWRKIAESFGLDLVSHPGGYGWDISGPSRNIWIRPWTEVQALRDSGTPDSEILWMYEVGYSSRRPTDNQPPPCSFYEQRGEWTWLVVYADEHVEELGIDQIRVELESAGIEIEPAVKTGTSRWPYNEWQEIHRKNDT